MTRATGRRSGAFAPTTGQEMAERGWDYVDVVFVTGDAYIDHPSFAMAILHRVLEEAGFRVAILSQPDWHSCEPWRQFGKPRLFFAISAGNMDSLINHYTANKKVRNDDAYSPGGKIGLRPDRATLPYCQRAREAFPGTPVIAGGVEASLRRLAHYDYWSDTVKRSILMDCKADLLVYGMGEKNILQIAKRLHAGQNLRDLRNLRGVAYALGARETEQTGFAELPETPLATTPGLKETAGEVDWKLWQKVPSFEEVKSQKDRFVDATRHIHLNTNPFNAAALIQMHDRQAVIATPPDYPLSESEMDSIYDLPYTRRPHPIYREPIPAFEMIKDSVTIMRGCFGGCTFCSITAHQGRIIQSRSQSSILTEIETMANDKDFKGIISDIGGATANMYQMRCTRPEIEAKCKRLSCIHPSICKLLGTDHKPTIELMRKAREVEGIRRVFVASGIRMDLAQLSPEYIDELAAHHVGGRLKVAPEHTHPDVLMRMKKPSIDNFGVFAGMFEKSSKKAKKPKQFLVPYFIASHPGSTIEEMIDLAIYLKRNGYRPDQVQDFIPAPFDIATCMWYTGIDPMTRKPVKIASKLSDRKLQRALLQLFKPENYFAVREALIEAKRTDLIGDGCDSLIPTNPPKEALDKRRRESQRITDGDHYHTVANSAQGEKPGERGANPLKSSGYRPQRKTQQRRQGKKNR
ncbi:YgiQ family radical SAM protein [Telmatocola sphagniphila]|uniref:YgiQ family radical SAM protein n=1 Tax=Telmatocola sphagniphila TaxID=1123043 RepID=A0A8E6BAF5_9BACT|nr:YgiQ family radical SAM protein [Telmatocola sphagniphila]